MSMPGTLRISGIFAPTSKSLFFFLFYFTISLSFYVKKVKELCTEKDEEDYISVTDLSQDGDVDIAHFYKDKQTLQASSLLQFFQNEDARWGLFLFFSHLLIPLLVFVSESEMITSLESLL